MLPNRVVVTLLFACGLGAAVLPVAANMDWQSIAGVLGGLGAVCAAGVTFLIGWQKHEAREAAAAAPSAAVDEPGDPDAVPHQPVVTDPPPDQGDAGHA